MRDEEDLPEERFIGIRKIGWALPAIFIVGMLALSLAGSPLFAGRPPAGAKLYMVMALLGVLGTLLYGLVIQQHLRIERLERRIARMTDGSGRR